MKHVHSCWRRIEGNSRQLSYSFCDEPSYGPEAPEAHAPLVAAPPSRALCSGLTLRARGNYTLRPNFFSNSA